MKPHEPGGRRYAVFFSHFYLQPSHSMREPLPRDQSDQEWHALYWGVCAFLHVAVSFWRTANISRVASYGDRIRKRVNQMQTMESLVSNVFISWKQTKINVLWNLLSLRNYILRRIYTFTRWAHSLLSRILMKLNGLKNAFIQF